MSNPTPEIVSQPQRLAILQHGGFSTRHGKTGLSLLRYRGAEVVAVIDRETAGRSLREVSKMPDVPDIRVVASAEEALASKPTALAIGAGGAFRAPMAIAVIGGLITSTVLSLLVIPVVFTYLDDLRQWMSRLFIRIQKK